MYRGAKTRVRTLRGDLKHFPVEMGLHPRSTLSPFLFALVMDVLMQDIQDKVSWCLLFADDIVLIDETQLRLRLSRTKTEYVECKFNDVIHEVGVEVRLDTQNILKRDRFKYRGSIILGGGDINDDITHHIGAT
ncbi:hypothetical protein H5410_022128 [Solanum commersonii]|uniref:Reverse transcriptase domain-containing protein n=1 Tax=Solanum commersonii TaxID=4109 RepID=A0A9J5ZFV7_SOLCO|nr:hypothetical protein H5410_022128 [Solanum commersonii]